MKTPTGQDVNDNPLDVSFLLNYKELAAKLHGISGKTLYKPQIDYFLSHNQDLFLAVLERGLDVAEVRAAFEQAATKHFK